MAPRLHLLTDGMRGGEPMTDTVLEHLLAAKEWERRHYRQDHPPGSPACLPEGPGEAVAITRCMEMGA